MKSVAGKVKLELAQYREMAAFAQFGSDLDKATQAQLNRGSRLVELLKQGRFMPMRVEQQVMAIFAGTKGYADDVPVDDVQRFRDGLLEFLENAHPEIGRTILAEQKLSDETAEALGKAIEEFKAGFETEGQA
jgi:F-type H+-transporting ATPase subunit alpha